VKYDPERDVWAPMSITEVSALLGGCTGRWWLSGGWAIDCWLGTVTRTHGDIDISTIRDDLPEVIGALPDRLAPFAAMDGHLFPLSARAADPGLHNIWVQHVTSGRWALQINIEDGDATSWRYRRYPQISTTWDFAVRVLNGVPTGSPATQLLWKSQAPRPQDDADLASAIGKLPERERRWLAHAIRSAHPSSPWVADARLTG
jgi:hypothetical protein